MTNPFEECAEVYAAFRPGYPHELYARLTGNLQPGARVLDLGAGTGKASRPLQARCDVILVEPGMAMARAGRDRNPEATYVCSKAEELPFPNCCADLVIAGQAAHWFDLDATLPEIARTLRPDGTLAFFWNNRNSMSPAAAAFEATLLRHNPTHVCPYRARPWGSLIAATGHFGPAEFHQFEFVVPMTPEDWIGLSRSISYIQVLGSDKCREFEEDLLRSLDGLTDTSCSYVTELWLARKL